MPHRYAAGVQIVIVTMANGPNGAAAQTSIWVAAVPRDRALSAVRAQIPAGCHVELSHWYLTQDQVAKLKLRPGEVREFKSTQIDKGLTWTVKGPRRRETSNVLHMRRFR
jgi:hypothetical protein